MRALYASFVFEVGYILLFGVGIYINHMPDPGE
jgi:hypothetical protein